MHIKLWGSTTLVVNEPFISEFQMYNINNYDIQNIEVWSFNKHNMNIKLNKIIDESFTI